MESKLKDFVAANIEGIDPNKLTIKKLFGQASARQYFRANTPDHSYVIMVLPQGFSSPAEEITKIAKDAPQEFPFINVQKYLHGLDIPVPTIYGKDDANGFLLLEDLGDQTLENLVKEADDTFFIFYYKKVIDTLIDFQCKTNDATDKNCIAYYRKFDADLLNWEFWHFAEYGLEDNLNIKLNITAVYSSKQTERIIKFY